MGSLLKTSLVINFSSHVILMAFSPKQPGPFIILSIIYSQIDLVKFHFRFLNTEDTEKQSEVCGEQWLEFSWDILYTGCSVNIVFFPNILKHIGLWSFSVFTWCQCVYTHKAGCRKPALAGELAEFRKIQNFKKKKHNS